MVEAVRDYDISPTPATADEPTDEELSSQEKSHSVIDPRPLDNPVPDNIVGAYISEIHRIPLLTAAREIELAKEIEVSKQAGENIYDSPQHSNR